MTTIIDNHTTDTAGIGPDAPGVLEYIDPRSLTPHPRNLRDDLGDLSALTASVAERGVLEPLIVVPDDGRYLIAAGHRRQGAAIDAGVALVPCVIRADLTADADVVITMLAENIRRSSLSVTEEARGYEQLSLLGLSAAKIAKATGTKVAKVRQALKVAGSEVAATTAARYSLNLDQALAVAEFDDDRDAVKTLVATAVKDPGQWRHVVSRLRQDREDAAAHQALIDGLAEQGIVVYGPDDLPATAARIDRLADDQGEPIDAEAHVTCPGHAVTFASWDPHNVIAICTDPDANGHVDRYAQRAAQGAERAKMTDEEKAERRTVVENNRAWRAAEPVRRDFVRNLIARRTAPKTTLRHVTETVLVWPTVVTAASDTETADLAGIDPTSLPAQRYGLAVALEGVTDARLPLLLLTRVAAGYEHDMGVHTWRRRDERAAWWLTWLASVGYDLSPIEQTVIDAVTPAADDNRADDDQAEAA